MTAGSVGTIDPTEVLQAFSTQLEARGFPNVGRDTDLNQMGLDSLVVAEIMLRVRQQFVDEDEDVNIPDDMPELSTVGDLVDLVIYMVGG